jgi:hypothetical protein
MLRILMLCLGFALSFAAGAQGYPDKTVTLIISSTPAGPANVLAQPLRAFRPGLHCRQ